MSCRVYIRGELCVDTLLTFRLQAIVNDHAYISYSGYVQQDTYDRYILQDIKNKVVKVLFDDQIVFTGYAIKIEIEEVNDLLTMHVQAVSFTKKIDIMPHNQSFKNTKSNYSEVLKTAFRKTPGSSILTPEGKTTTKKPIIQFKETEWQFCLRMASRLNITVVPNIFSDFPEVSFGYGDSRIKKAQPENLHIEYKSSIQKKLADPENRNHQIGMTFFDEQVFHLGDLVSIRGHQLRIVEKKHEIRSSMLMNWYVASTEKNSCLEYFENTRMAGQLITGTVLDRKGKRIKLHLDIDRAQDLATAYWFPFVPAHSNGGVYCMPEIGTKAVLQCLSGREEESIVIHCFRENGLQCADTMIWEYRYLTTDHFKRLAMLPSDLYFWGIGNKLHLSDDLGIHANAKKRIVIQSKKEVILSANGPILLESMERIRAVKRSTRSGISLAADEVDVVAQGKAYIDSDPDGLIVPDQNEIERFGTADIPFIVALTILAAQPSTVPQRDREHNSGFDDLGENALGSVRDTILASNPVISTLAAILNDQAVQSLDTSPYSITVKASTLSSVKNG